MRSPTPRKLAKVKLSLGKLACAGCIVLSVAQCLILSARLRGHGMTGGNIWKAGRVVLDNDAIAQKRFLGLFGTEFKLRWCDIVSWNVRDTVLLDRSTGKERVISRVLSLYRKGRVDFIWRSVRDRRFPLIVDMVQRRLPEKENYPVEFDLERIARMRNS